MMRSLIYGGKTLMNTTTFCHSTSFPGRI